MAGSGTAASPGLGKTSLPRVPVVAAPLLPQARSGQCTTRISPLEGACQYKTREKIHVINLASIRSRVVCSVSMSDPDRSGGAWTLLTGHGHVLVEIARNPAARIRDVMGLPY